MLVQTLIVCAPRDVTELWWSNAHAPLSVTPLLPASHVAVAAKHRCLLAAHFRIALSVSSGLRRGSLDARNCQDVGGRRGPAGPGGVGAGGAGEGGRGRINRAIREAVRSLGARSGCVPGGAEGK